MRLAGLLCSTTSISIKYNIYFIFFIKKIKPIIITLFFILKTQITSYFAT